MNAKTKVETFKMLEAMLKQLKDLSNLSLDFKMNLSREIDNMIEEILRIEQQFDKYKHKKTLIDKITRLREDVHKMDTAIYLFKFRCSLLKRAMEVSILNLIKDIEGENDGEE